MSYLQHSRSFLGTSKTEVHARLMLDVLTLLANFKNNHCWVANKHPSVIISFYYFEGTSVVFWLCSVELCQTCSVSRFSACFGFMCKWCQIVSVFFILLVFWPFVCVFLRLRCIKLSLYEITFITRSEISNRHLPNARKNLCWLL